MKFEIINRDEYDKFFNKAKYNHMLQTSAWVETCRVRGQFPWYVALKNEKGKIVAATAMLQRKLPLNLSYFYAPRGFLIDFYDDEIFTEFTKGLKNFLKEQNAINLNVDPGIMYHEIDEVGNAIENGKNNYDVYDRFLKNGYIHKGFTKGFELSQPRYTYRIDTTKDLSEIEKDMDKSFAKKLKRSYSYELEISNHYTTEEFFGLMREIADKDNFNGHSKEFYTKFHEEFTKLDQVEYISVKIYPEKIINNAKNKIEKLNKLEKKNNDTLSQIKRLEKDIEVFTPYKDKKDGIISLIQICPKTNKHMWTLYIGNNSLAAYTSAVNRTMYEAIKRAKEQNFEFLDLFGTVGDAKTLEKNYAGIHEFKKSVGGQYVEFIGEFTLINKKVWYKIMPRLLKLYRKMKKNGTKSNRQKNV